MAQIMVAFSGSPLALGSGTPLGKQIAEQCNNEYYAGRNVEQPGSVRMPLAILLQQPAEIFRDVAHVTVGQSGARR